jgi:hypothetical protein
MQPPPQLLSREPTPLPRQINQLRSGRHPLPLPSRLQQRWLVNYS